MSPAKRQRRSRPVLRSGVTRRIALNERIGVLQKEINRLRRSREAVSRGEFREVVKSLHQIQDNTDAVAKHTVDLATQLTRLAQLQAEVDEMKRALKRARLLD